MASIFISSPTKRRNKPSDLVTAERRLDLSRL